MLWEKNQLSTHRRLYINPSICRGIVRLRDSPILGPCLRDTSSFLISCAGGGYSGGCGSTCVRTTSRSRALVSISTYSGSVRHCAHVSKTRRVKPISTHYSASRALLPTAHRAAIVLVPKTVTPSGSAAETLVLHFKDQFDICTAQLKLLRVGIETHLPSSCESL